MAGLVSLAVNNDMLDVRKKACAPLARKLEGKDKAM